MSTVPPMDDPSMRSASLSPKAEAPMCSPGCGSLQWTVEKWGRVVHKHSCVNRRTPYCQTHPNGCPLTDEEITDYREAVKDAPDGPEWGSIDVARLLAYFDAARTPRETPYLELFARRRRYGWDVWGNEAPETAASQAELGLDALTV